DNGGTSSAATAETAVRACLREDNDRHRPRPDRVEALRGLASWLHPRARNRSSRRGRKASSGPTCRVASVPLPAIVRAPLAAAKRRAAASSVAPIAGAIGAPCVLASLAFRTPETRDHDREAH